MAGSKRAGKSTSHSVSTPRRIDDLPEPFKRPPDVLLPFMEPLSKRHVYITHIDSLPVRHKRNIFLMPVAINALVVVLFTWRIYAVWPWYWALVVGSFGYESATTFATRQASWSDISNEIIKRTLTLCIDFLLFVFLWPWPVRFTLGRHDGSPTRWRWSVGFRSREICVRRSKGWDKEVRHRLRDADAHKTLMEHVQQATSPLLQDQKTGYLLQNAHWDLDWDAMVCAHALVESKKIALDAFRNVVFFHDEDYGWVCYDQRARESVDEEDKRRQVFLFRDALTVMGKEDLFYRWVEVVQYEATQPGGFGPEKQEVAAQRIRDMFDAENVDFDKVWQEAVGTTPSTSSNG